MYKLISFMVSRGGIECLQKYELHQRSANKTYFLNKITRKT